MQNPNLYQQQQYQKSNQPTYSNNPRPLPIDITTPSTSKIYELPVKEGGLTNFVQGYDDPFQPKKYVQKTANQQLQSSKVQEPNLQFSNDVRGPQMQLQPTGLGRGVNPGLAPGIQHLNIEPAGPGVSDLNLFNFDKWRIDQHLHDPNSGLAYKITDIEKDIALKQCSWFWAQERLFDVIAIFVLIIMFIFDMMISLIKPNFPDLCILIIMGLLIIGAYKRELSVDVSSSAPMHNIQVVENGGNSTSIGANLWIGFNDIYRLLPLLFVGLSVVDLAWLIIYGMNWCGNDIYDNTSTSGLLCKSKQTAITYTIWNLLLKLFLSIYLWFKSVRALKDAR